MSTPRRKRYKQKVRLQIAAVWIKDIESNHVKRYAKWYGVSRLCAALELTQIGVKLAEGTLEKEKAVELQKQKAGILKREKKLAEENRRIEELMLFNEEFEAYYEDEYEIDDYEVDECEIDECEIDEYPMDEYRRTEFEKDEWDIEDGFFRLGEQDFLDDDIPF